MDEFNKYPFVKHNIDKNKLNKCNPMGNGQYPTIIQNLDNRERERGIPIIRRFSSKKLLLCSKSR